jgi:hypothetical protein
MIAEIIFLGVFLLADSGYQGIPEYHENSEIPIKKPKGGELTEDETSRNRELSRRRVPIEWVNNKDKDIQNDVRFISQPANDSSRKNDLNRRYYQRQ